MKYNEELKAQLSNVAKCLDELANAIDEVDLFEMDEDDELYEVIEDMQWDDIRSKATKIQIAIGELEDEDLYLLDEDEDWEEDEE